MIKEAAATVAIFVIGGGSILVLMVMAMQA